MQENFSANGEKERSRGKVTSREQKKRGLLGFQGGVYFPIKKGDLQKKRDTKFPRQS